MNKTISRAVRGMQDILGDAMSAHNYLSSIASDIAAIYCYQELSTPIIEYSNVFHRTLGEASDIITKETYSFLDRDKTSLTLRPELTASIVRAALSNNLFQDLPLKIFSIGPLFRHERPQKGRHRQFHQASYEFFGPKSEFADVEIISMAHNLLQKLGLDQEIKLNINTIGYPEHRGEYIKSLVQYLSKYKDELSEESQSRLIKNPLRILDSKNINDKAILQDAPKIINFLSIEEENRYNKLLQNLTALEIKYVHNDYLVRGLDYYTGTVFEFVTEHLGSQGTVIAGGRYDNLVQAMGGNSIPAIGFAIGIERLVELVMQKSTIAAQQPSITIIPIGKNAENYSIKLLHTLRSQQIATHLDYDISLKKRMQKANKSQCNFAIIFGDDELSQKKCILKNMKTGNETIIEIEKITNYIT